MYHAQIPEYGIQAALVLIMLLSRRWVVLLIHLPILAYHVRTFALDAYKTDVTEIFRQLPRERRIRIIKLGIYMGGFVFIVYKCVPVTEGDGNCAGVVMVLLSEPPPHAYIPGCMNTSYGAHSV